MSNPRTCLLSVAYTGDPLTFNGREIHYSAVANEVIRELKSSLFHENGDKEQTEFHSMAEAILVMKLISSDDIDGIKTLRSVNRETRHRMVTDFILDNQSEVQRLIPEIAARMKALMAAGVESEGQGKSQAQAPDSLRS